MPPASALKQPKRLTGIKVGKYTLAELLGQGGYGDVYVGVPGKSGSNVAVKLLDPTHARDADTIERFQREADTAKRLAHPNIVRTLDVGSSRGRHYIVMELVRGGSLHRMLRRDPPAEKLMAVLVDTARALAYAHAQGIVHRDVKPGNILLTRSGKAKVADFGLARVIDQTSMTTEGRLLGTASYMSPEQAKGERATAASDVYAMGVILYEVIAGAQPFSSDTQIGYLYQHLEVEPSRPAVKPPYPPALATLALECLAKDPKARPTMQAVADRLAAMSLARPRKRRVIAIAAIALVVLALLAICFPQLVDRIPLVRVGAHRAHDAIF